MRALCIAGGIRPGQVAALLAFAVDGLYLALIAQQGGDAASRVPFVAVSIAGAGVVAATAELLPTVAGGPAAAWAAATLWIWTVLASASIGIAIAPAAVFATIALTRREAPSVAVTAGIGLGFLTAAAGLAWTG
jgi:hypothetical protein